MNNSDLTMVTEEEIKEYYAKFKRNVDAKAITLRLGLLYKNSENDVWVVPNNVREQREKSGLSTKQLSTCLGISPSHLLKIENNHANLSIEIAYLCSQIFSCDIMDLYDVPQHKPVTKRKASRYKKRAEELEFALTEIQKITNEKIGK